MRLAYGSGILALLLTCTACNGRVQSYADRYDGGFEREREDPNAIEAQRLEEKIHALHGQLEEVENELHELKEASARLQGDVDRFDSEDWSDVVPDVVDANDELQSAVEETEEKISQLSSSF
jgi:predicted  nucleic acid-binding Zn-ribbon protein